MDYIYFTVEIGVSVACAVNRLYQIHGAEIATDVREGAPKLMQGIIPSKYEIPESIKLPHPKQKVS